MPHILVSESISVELGAKEPWPTDVTFYQPYEYEQILMPDSASCLSVEAFLKMCQLSYTKESRSNAEAMSPTGKVPFIKAGAFVVAELDSIIAFVAHKNVSLTNDLDPSQKSDMKAYMCLVNNILTNAELYCSWVDDTIFNEVTRNRYGSVYPWPLNHILTLQKRRQIVNKLRVLKWKEKTLDEVHKDVDRCCSALAERLDNQPYFFGDKPTELDALVFGHLFTLLCTSLPDNHLVNIVRSYESLADLCQRIDRKYFKRSITSGPSSHVSSRSGNGDYDKLEDINSDLVSKI